MIDNLKLATIAFLASFFCSTLAMSMMQLFGG